MSTMQQQTGYEDQLSEHDSQQRLIPGLLVTILILALLGFIGTKLVDPSTLPVRHVSVSGDFVHLSPVSLQERVSEVVKNGFFNINVETIQNVLLQEPWVMEVSVKRIWPDKITVNIREQNAIAQWGVSGLLNSNAHIFYPDPSTFPENLPIIIGPDISAGLVMDQLIQIQNVLPEGLVVNELSLSDRRSWKLMLNNGLLIRLGKHNIKSRLEQFFRYFPVSAMSRLGQIQYIDMRYTNGFVIRWYPDTKSELNNGQVNNGEKI
jgi:cell division protein FtsQ